MFVFAAVVMLCSVVLGQYTWHTSDYSQCEYVCSEPTQSRNVTCRQDSNDDLVADSLCAALASRPTSTNPCGLQLGVTYDFEFGAGTWFMRVFVMVLCV